MKQALEGVQKSVEETPETSFGNSQMPNLALLLANQEDRSGALGNPVAKEQDESDSSLNQRNIDH